MDNNLSTSFNEEDWKTKIITPRVAVVGIVESPDRSKILMIERIYPPLGQAFPGGMVELGETIEQAAVREVLEETNIESESIGLLNILSDPKYDSRWHVVIIYLIMRAKDMKEPKGGDDAKNAFWVDIDKVPKYIISAESIYNDYLKWRNLEWNLLKTK